MGLLIEDASSQEADGGAGEGGRRVDGQPWDQDEGPVGGAGVGQDQVGLTPDFGAGTDEVDVEGAGSAGDLAGTVGPRFDGQCPVQQVWSRQAGLDDEDSIEEVLLFYFTLGDRVVDRGHPGVFDTWSCHEDRHRELQVVEPGFDVGSEREDNPSRGTPGGRWT